MAEPPKMYSGCAFREFLIDRYAMGFAPEDIQAEFERLMGATITREQMDGILQGAGPEIQAREKEFMKELMSNNVVVQLSEINSQLREVRDLARREGDYKTYANLTSVAINGIGVVVKMTEAFRSRVEQRTKLASTNNFNVFVMLAKDGVIDIKDEPKLRELFKVPIEARRDVTENGRE